ncbi:hypothetical protein [Zhihengliuella halotolerans]|uniref:Uncharacterized protein n=1 Tax=Zhihengliuella halotolerans TaxID=370736 RepID=A0A4Q8AFA8_9MICC|nr:hypothetical protein [Zhihengliuella halotolerans]RZU62987.1 hypothetical protein EV380_2593 [Zhihengliuella halotolerans]
MDLNDELDEEVVAEAFGKIHPEVLLEAEFVALRKSRSGRNVLVHRDLTGCLLARFFDPLLEDPGVPKAGFADNLNRAIVVDVLEPCLVYPDFRSEDTLRVREEFPDAVWAEPLAASDWDGEVGVGVDVASLRG